MLMDASLNHRINYELLLLERARKEYVARLEQLREYKGTVLKRTKPQNSTLYYYSAKQAGSKSFCYLGPSDHSVVRRVKEARFLEEAIRRIDRDIYLLNSLSAGFLPFDPGSISESLPAVYRCEVPPVSERYATEGLKWKTKRMEQLKRFPENYPDGKKHTTSDGFKVRTISEMTLYEMFKASGLIQIYELPFPVADYGPPMYPDITILSPVDLKTEIIVEFVGRLDKPNYRMDFAKRIERYMVSGYIPGVNLFFIYGDWDGNFDSTQVTKVIADIKGLRP